MPRPSKGSRTLITSRVPSALAIDVDAWAADNGFRYVSDAVADLLAMALQKEQLPSAYMPGVVKENHDQGVLDLPSDVPEAMLKAS